MKSLEVGPELLSGSGSGQWNPLLPPGSGWSGGSGLSGSSLVEDEEEEKLPPPDELDDELDEEELDELDEELDPGLPEVEPPEPGGGP
jgi:hypothetical protein